MSYLAKYERRLHCCQVTLWLRHSYKLKDDQASLMLRRPGPDPEAADEVSAMPMMRKSAVYHAYLKMCRQEGLVPRFKPPALGRMVKNTFPGVRTKRIGPRGSVVQYYIGLMHARPQPDSEPPSPQVSTTTSTSTISAEEPSWRPPSLLSSLHADWRGSKELRDDAKPPDLCGDQESGKGGSDEGGERRGETTERSDDRERYGQEVEVWGGGAWPCRSSAEAGLLTPTWEWRQPRPSEEAVIAAEGVGSRKPASLLFPDLWKHMTTFPSLEPLQASSTETSAEQWAERIISRPRSTAPSKRVREISRENARS